MPARFGPVGVPSHGEKLMSIKNQQAGASDQDQGRDRDRDRDRSDEPIIGQAISQTSGQHQGLHHPDDDQRVKQALDDADLADLGESAEDQLRDRGGRGLPDTGIKADDDKPGKGRKH